MLIVALLLMTSTGWPSYAILLGVSWVAALGGVAAGAFDWPLLTSLPLRIVGLLEHDLLQALVLYALVGALLHRLALADIVYRGLFRGLLRCTRRSPETLAGFGLGTLFAPMNGSVAASLLLLSRTASVYWQRAGMAGAERVVHVAVISTLGVIVPPSLVLLLLGDALMRAHTEALSGAVAGAGLVRVINTQDVLQAALLPGALLWLVWLGVAWWRAPVLRPIAADASLAACPALSRQERWVVALVPGVIVSLLVLVTLGRVRAVEAAASAGVLLMLYGVATRQLKGPLLRQVLDDAMALSGALFALLVAATSFSLLLRAYGTDHLVAEAMQALHGRPLLATLAVEVGLLACAFVLDAFELIFLVVPIVMPPLLAEVGDAGWIAAITLLVLQAGFLLPPFGYALVLARAMDPPRQSLLALLRALWPYLGAVLAVLGLVLAAPGLTHWLRSAPEANASAQPISAEEVDALMRAMSSRSEAPDPPAPAASQR
jgi:TRAP-type mannitol/chloroaromatic compound transport system permease large subunit